VLGRAIRERQTFAAAPQQAFLIRRRYDAAGRLRKLIYPDDSEVTYRWNKRGELKTVLNDGEPPLTRYKRLKNGLVKSLAFENSVRSVKTYDAANQTLKVVHRSPEENLGQHAYEYDIAGRRTSQKFGDGSRDVYEYDASDQLVRAVYRNSQERTVQKFGYDAMGNRKFAQTGNDRTTYQVNSANQYTSVNASTSPPDGRWTYDQSGNLLSDGTRQMVWNHHNQLIGFTNEQGEVVNYAHDIQGRRVQRTDGSGKTTLYIYEGWNCIAEYEAHSGSAPSLSKTLTWGEDLSGSLQGAGGVGGLLMVQEIDQASKESQPNFFQYDANGNVTQITDQLGQSVAKYRYDGFGNTLASSGDYAETNAYRFSTKPIDEVSNWYYYGYRYYDPVTGRWPSRDPIQERGGYNLYNFVGNDSVNQWDLLGMSWKKVNCLDVSLDNSISTFVGVGGSIGISIRGEKCDCCNTDTGKTISNGFILVTATANASIGIGFGAETQVFNKRIGFTVRGPSVSSSVSGEFNKKCDGSVSGGVFKTLSYDKGGAVSGGLLGVSAKGQFSIKGSLRIGLEANSGGIDFINTRKLSSTGRVEFALGPVKVGRNFRVSSGELPGGEPPKRIYSW